MSSTPSAGAVFERAMAQAISEGLDYSSISFQLEMCKKMKPLLGPRCFLDQTDVDGFVKGAITALRDGFSTRVASEVLDMVSLLAKGEAIMLCNPSLRQELIVEILSSSLPVRDTAVKTIVALWHQVPHHVTSAMMKASKQGDGASWATDEIMNDTRDWTLPGALPRLYRLVLATNGSSVPHAILWLCRHKHKEALIDMLLAECTKSEACSLPKDTSNDTAAIKCTKVSRVDARNVPTSEASATTSIGNAGVESNTDEAVNQEEQPASPRVKESMPQSVFNNCTFHGKVIIVGGNMKYSDSFTSLGDDVLRDEVLEDDEVEAPGTF
ncbi:hypothetical protein DIURU_002522 [Diutina rugosa]|uniref:Uncharacterized protein n=1 Tax=Diutina rugosa TaxID=5481 RepID=A0A642UQ06_DIURU|nr:uncharacterized protein DIURU_002522 [Diutina rugosa]KAA8903235.1 hypothetical protein DIURU_002522 [Diutina rugosa]